MEEYFRIKYAAAEIGITNKNLRQHWINKGKIQVLRIGGVPFVTREEIERVKAIREKKANREG